MQQRQQVLLHTAADITARSVYLPEGLSSLLLYDVYTLIYIIWAKPGPRKTGCSHKICSWWRQDMKIFYHYMDK